MDQQSFSAMLSSRNINNANNEEDMYNKYHTQFKVITKVHGKMHCRPFKQSLNMTQKNFTKQININAKQLLRLKTSILSDKLPVKQDSQESPSVYRPKKLSLPMAIDLSYRTQREQGLTLDQYQYFDITTANNTQVLPNKIFYPHVLMSPQSTRQQVFSANGTNYPLVARKSRNKDEDVGTQVNDSRLFKKIHGTQQDLSVSINSNNLRLKELVSQVAQQYRESNQSRNASGSNNSKGVSISTTSQNFYNKEIILKSKERRSFKKVLYKVRQNREHGHQRIYSQNADQVRIQDLLQEQSELLQMHQPSLDQNKDAYVKNFLQMRINRQKLEKRTNMKDCLRQSMRTIDDAGASKTFEENHIPHYKNKSFINDFDYADGLRVQKCVFSANSKASGGRRQMIIPAVIKDDEQQQQTQSKKKITRISESFKVQRQSSNNNNNNNNEYSPPKPIMNKDIINIIK